MFSLWHKGGGELASVKNGSSSTSAFLLPAERGMDMKQDGESDL